MADTPPSDRDPIDTKTGTQLAPPPPPPGYAAAYPAPDSGKKQGNIQKVLGGLVASVLIISLLTNFYLIQYVSLLTAGPYEHEYQAGETEDRIVIIPIMGMITDETAGFVHSSLKLIEEDEPAAVILRVNSPGGGVNPSDRIWHELSVYRKNHPNVKFIASFGGTAASGGYYVSALSDHIFAEPTTITGSIGVIAHAFTVKGLLDKVGVTPEIIASSGSNNKDILSPMRDWTEKDRDQLRVILDSAYGRFVHVVHSGRKDHLSEEAVRSLATGAPYTCDEALNNKLIDEEGYLDDAIKKAASLAGMSDSTKPRVNIVGVLKPFGLVDLLGAKSSNPMDSLSSDNARQWVTEMSMAKVSYLFMP